MCFWDYDIGCVGSMHHSNLWNHFALRQFCEASRLSPYVLVNGVAYLARPWMFPPCKGHKDGSRLKNIY
jgi:hypothetical protein